MTRSEVPRPTAGEYEALLPELPSAPYPIEDLIVSAPLDIYRDKVIPQWLDYNGHMNVGYYVVAFDRATTALCRQIGIAAEYTTNRIGMYFVLECHVNYESTLR